MESGGRVCLFVELYPKAVLCIQISHDRNGGNRLVDGYINGNIRCVVGGTFCNISGQRPDFGNFFGGYAFPHQLCELLKAAEQSVRVIRSFPVCGADGFGHLAAQFLVFAQFLRHPVDVLHALELHGLFLAVFRILGAHQIDKHGAGQVVRHVKRMERVLGKRAVFFLRILLGRACVGFLLFGDSLHGFFRREKGQQAVLLLLTGFLSFPGFHGGQIEQRTVLSSLQELIHQRSVVQLCQVLFGINSAQVAGQLRRIVNSFFEKTDRRRAVL